MTLTVLIISIVAFSAVTLITVGLVQFVGDRGGEAMAAREAQNRRALEELFIQNVTPRQVTAITAVAALVLALLLQVLTNNIVLALGAGIGVLFLPPVVFAYMRQQRLDRFNEQLPDGLGILGTSARAGLSLTQAVEQVSEQASGPLAQEFNMIMQEVRLGADLGKAIEAARDRIGSRTFRLVSTAIQLNREKGGNLPEALDTMSNSLQEIWRLEQKLITASAEGRKAVWWISGMPIFIFFFVSATQPSLVNLLVSSIWGMALLLLAVLLYGSGLFWLLRILRSDV